MLARLPVLILLLAACHPGPRAEAPPAPTLGALEVQTLEGEATRLATRLAARPTLVTLWATWCESCAEEFPALARLAPKAEAQGAYVVAIAEGEARETVAGFVRARDLRYPQLVDERFTVADAIGARRIPATLVLDRRGALVYRGGALDHDALAALDAAIARP